MTKSPLDRVRTQRAPRYHRGARRAILLLALAVVAVAAGLTIIWHADTPTQSASPTAAANAKPPPEGASCKERPTREVCHDVIVDGRTRRYALLRADMPTASTVIVDFGGPGEAVLSGENHLAAFRSAYKPLATGYNILVIEEPWVTQPLSESCESELSAYYVALHSLSIAAAETHGANLSSNCGLGDGTGRWGYTPAAYASTIRAIEDREDLRIQGFIGYSWGAARHSYLERKLDFAALVRPFPIGTRADRLVEARSQLTMAAPDGPDQTASSQAEGRSLPITAFDRLSAAVALSYVDDAHLDKAKSALSTNQDPVLIGRLSDQLWKRYGANSVSPAILAQLDEICPTAGAMPRPLTQITSTRDVLAAQFIPCRYVPQREATPRKALKTCVVSSGSDAVTPDALVRSVFAGNGVTIVDSKQRSHGSFDGLDKCLKAVLP